MANILDHVLFADNASIYPNNIIDTDLYSGISFNHVTFVNNQGSENGAISASFLHIANSIFSNNWPDHFNYAYGEMYYSNIDLMGDAWDGMWADSIGIIFEDPMFVDPDNGDYHLLPGSPCIDAGDPEYELDPDGTFTDMGYCTYELYYECDLMGDTNQDGVVNVQDIIVIVNFIVMYEPCVCADMDLSGNVDVLDVIQVVNIIIGENDSIAISHQTQPILDREKISGIQELKLDLDRRRQCPGFQGRATTEHTP